MLSGKFILLWCAWFSSSRWCLWCGCCHTTPRLAVKLRKPFLVDSSTAVAVSTYYICMQGPLPQVLLQSLHGCSTKLIMPPSYYHVDATFFAPLLLSRCLQDPLPHPTAECGLSQGSSCGSAVDVVLNRTAPGYSTSMGVPINWKSLVVAVGGWCRVSWHAFRS